MSSWGFAFLAFGFVVVVASTLGEGAVKAFGFTIPFPLKEHAKLMRSIGALSCASGVIFLAAPGIWHAVTKPAPPGPSQPMVHPPCEATRSNPAITVSPTAAARGAVVRVTGAGFCPKEPVKFFVGNDNYAGVFPADARGNFSQDITIPRSTPSSIFSTFIKARGTVSDKSITTGFTIG